MPKMTQDQINVDLFDEVKRLQNNLANQGVELEAADKVIVNLKEELRQERLRLDTLEATLRTRSSYVELSFYEQTPHGFSIEVHGSEPWSHVGTTLRECLDANVAKVFHNPKGKC